MSERVTVIELDGVEIAEWGHLSREEALRRASAHFLAEWKRSLKALNTLNFGKPRVFHQLNLHAAKNRRELKP